MQFYFLHHINVFSEQNIDYTEPIIFGFTLLQRSVHSATCHLWAIEDAALIIMFVPITKCNLYTRKNYKTNISISKVKWSAPLKN